MASLIAVYTIVVAIILAFILCAYLTSHNYIMKYTDNWFKRFFAHPMLMYSIKRIGSALISVLLTVVVTFFLLRIDDPRTPKLIKVYEVSLQINPLTVAVSRKHTSFGKGKTS